MAKMNIRTIGAWRAAISVAVGVVAGPALAGLDFTPPQLPQELQAPAGSPEREWREKADMPGLQIAPGVSLSPDLGSSSPYATVDPSNARQPVEPLLRLQVPIPP